MDWLWDMFAWDSAGWALVVLLGLALIVLIRRIWHSGLGSYGESHEKMAQRIRETRAEIRDRNNAMSMSEQLQILTAGLQEVLDLEGNPPGCAVSHCEGGIGLDTPQGRWLVIYAPRQATLRGSARVSGGRVLHGVGQWQVRHEGAQPLFFGDLGQLMRYLCTVVRQCEDEMAEDSEAPEFARRFARRPQTARK